jgi:hypothetical protein
VCVCVVGRRAGGGGGGGLGLTLSTKAYSLRLKMGSNNGSFSFLQAKIIPSSTMSQQSMGISLSHTELEICNILNRETKNLIPHHNKITMMILCLIDHKTCIILI